MSVETANRSRHPTKSLLHHAASLLSTWSGCMDKRPCDRTSEDLDTIYSFLKEQEAFRRFHPYLLQQMCYYIYYERLHRGVVLFRQGDIGTCWYTVLSGSLQVTVSNISDYRSAVPLCILGKGSVFGENTMEDTPRHSTVITNEECELLIIQLENFRIMWEKNQLFLRDLNLPRSPEVVDEANASPQHRQHHSSRCTAAVGGAIAVSGATVAAPIEDVSSRNLPPPPCSSTTHQSSVNRFTHRSGVVKGVEHALISSPVADSDSLPGVDDDDDDEEEEDDEDDEDYPPGPPSLMPPSPSPPTARRSRSMSGGRLRSRAAIAPEESLPRDSPSPEFPPSDFESKTPSPDGATGKTIKDETLSHPVGVALSPTGEEFEQAGRLFQLFIHNHHPGLLSRGGRSMTGSGLITAMCDFAQTDNRQLSQGALQVLLEEGAMLGSGRFTQMIHDGDSAHYRFHRAVTSEAEADIHSVEMQKAEGLREVSSVLVRLAPDALFRMILRKPPKDRSSEELDFIYGELLHIKALTHLSTMVKKELTVVLMFESHPKSGKVLFYQGDEGDSWYIILKGSVEVVIEGKGVVCTLEESDDFGKLALVNDAPRAATIMLREDNCHFLRVAKDDFNRILRDVEANTVRLQEHGKNVIVLEKIPTPRQANTPSRYQYSVVAGTPEKMLEHLLETRIESLDYYLGHGPTEEATNGPDPMLEDFLLTHPIFMPTQLVCSCLMEQYQADRYSGGANAGALMANGQSMARSTPPGSDVELRDMYLLKKRKVVAFVHWWYQIIRRAFVEDKPTQAFLVELGKQTQADCCKFPMLKEEADAIQTVLHLCEQDRAAAHKQLARGGGRNSSSCRGKASVFQPPPPLRSSDKTTFKVYFADHTYRTVQLPLDATVIDILKACQSQFNVPVSDLVCCEVRSSGERVVFKDKDLGITTGLSSNGRLFATASEHIGALTPLNEQNGPNDSTFNFIEMTRSDEFAFQMTVHDWELLENIHVYELIYMVFGRHKYQKITANLDVFLRRFSEIQFWVATEICLTHALNKRVTILKKFIKIAAKLLDYQNLNAFIAMMMGMNNSAVSRLSQTWDKLPSKYKKIFSELDSMLDPSRNHRLLRQTTEKWAPPIIPFMPLMMKDMTFIHEGNRTRFEGLINFDKMQMIARSLKLVLRCRKKPLIQDHMPRDKTAMEIRRYVRQLNCNDNQKVLVQLSHGLEPKKF